MRHQPHLPSRGRVQDLLPLNDIHGAVVRLRDGGYRGVLAVGGTPFALRSPAEQEAILAGYRAFLNSLEHPVQILVRLAPVDVEAYLGGLAPPAGRGPALARLALDHEAFVRGLVRRRTVLDRRCYLVLPAEEPSAAAVPLRPSTLFRRSAPADPRHAGRAWEGATRSLQTRAGALIQGLVAFGVQAHRLDEDDLLALWGAMLRPAHGRAGPLGSAAAHSAGAGDRSAVRPPDAPFHQSHAGGVR